MNMLAQTACGIVAIGLVLIGSSGAVALAEAGGCEVTCPAGGVPEGEPVCEDDYIDTYNGGCGSDPVAFQPISCGDVICGTSGTFYWGGSTIRETDWYEVTLAEYTLLRWEVIAEYPVSAFIIAAHAANCYDYEIVEYAFADPCEPTAAVYCAPPGTYWLWTAPSVFEDVPCGAPYVATMTCAPASGDVNCDGAVDFGDIDPFVLALTGEQAYYAEYPDCHWFNADTNDDGSVDFDDIDPFVALLSG